MSKLISRNDPCPCGSGKKYKHCCINAPSAKSTRMSKLALFVAALSVPVGATVGYLRDDLESGIMSGLITLVVGFGVQIFRNPPPSRGRGGADRIGFGV